MNALEALHTRQSINLLCDPAPSALQLDNIFKAAVRACDHRCLKPWKYLIIQGEMREKLGELMATVKAEKQGTPLSEKNKQTLIKKALRAPMIIVVVANIQTHEKVPEIEQILSAGASAQMIMTAAHAQGVGAIWRSGDLMFHPKMQQGLQLEETDQIIGFIYMGTPKTNKQKPIQEKNYQQYVHYWKA